MALSPSKMITSLPQAIVLYYAKVSNGNVSLQQCSSFADPAGMKVRVVCNVCYKEYRFSQEQISELIMAGNVSMDVPIFDFCTEHRHEDQGINVMYKPAKAAAKSMHTYVATVEISEERVFKDL